MWLERAAWAVIAALTVSSGCNALWGVDKLEYDRRSSGGTGATTSTTSTTTDVGGSGGMGGAGGAGGAAGGPHVAECGDGVIEGDEQCDDANAEPDDGCHDCDVQCDATDEHEHPTTHHCYLLYPARRTWTTSQDDCASWGGHLASLTSAAENDFAEALLAADTWIGGNDRDTEGTFAWVNGELWGYVDWGTGQPDNYNGEDCVEIGVPELTWNDVGCGRDRYGLCEREPPEGAAGGGGAA